MKKLVYLIALATLFAGACTKDEIENTGADGTESAKEVDNEGDDVSNTSFSGTITITYSENGATVSGDELGYVSVSGNNVTVNNTGTDNIIYVLQGSTSNGYFKLYSDKKQEILLGGVSITNPNGAAINNQSGKRTFVVVEGNNHLSDSESASYSSDNEDMKAVFFSEGQLVFSGSGSLTVNAVNKQGKSALTSDDYVHLTENVSLKLNAGSGAGHGLRGKDYVQLSGGKLDITTAAAMKKGITTDGFVLVEGGTHNITVTGGVAYDSESSEYKGSAGIKADNYFAMTGGAVTITNSGNGGKGVRAGSYDYVTNYNAAVEDSYITGGTLIVKTTGSEKNDESAKGIKIGYKEDSGRSYLYGGNLKISGGSVQATVSNSEGLEAKGNITISGGDVYVYSTGDDAINSQGTLSVSGGHVFGYSTANDGLDSNGDTKLSGGYVFAITTRGAPEVAIDANTEERYKLYIENGATLIAYGGLESGYSASQTVYSMSASAGAWNALYDGSSFIAAFKAPSGLSNFAVSAPSLGKGYTGVSVSGDTFCNGSLAGSGISGGSAVDLGTYSNQGGGPGGGGGGGWPGGPGGH